MDWLLVWGPSILAVVVAAGFTWAFGAVNEWQHREGIRTLLSQELWHNESSVMALRGYLKMLEDTGNLRIVVQVLRDRQSLPPWQRARWDLPDVGAALNREELTRFTEWYVKLDYLVFLYDGLMNDAAKAPLIGKPAKVPEPTATAFMDVLRSVITFADDMIAHAPPLLDQKLLRDPKMQKYGQELLERQAARQQREAQENAGASE